MGRKNETFSEFEARVLAETGMALADIPVAESAEDLLGGHIVAHHFQSNTFVFYAGYPAYQDEDGTPFWVPEEAARRIVP